MNEVVVGIDGLDWYQPADRDSENWLMKPPTACQVRPLGQIQSFAPSSGAWRSAAGLLFHR